MKSDGYKRYLIKKRIEKILIRVMQVFIIVFIIVLWQYLADKKIINTFIFSSPKLVINTIANLYKDNSLFNHIFTTTIETLSSFLMCSIIGIFIAVILWYNSFIAKVLDPYLTILNSLPKVAMAPILIIILGANIRTIITTSILIAIVTTIISIYNGFLSTDSSKIKLLKSMHANKIQMLRYLVIPSNVSNIIGTLKITLSLSLIGVITSELLVSKRGIGYLIMYGSDVFNLSLVIAGIIILMMLSFILYEIICYIEKILIKFF